MNSFFSCSTARFPDLWKRPKYNYVIWQTISATFKRPLMRSLSEVNLNSLKFKNLVKMSWTTISSTPFHDIFEMSLSIVTAAILRFFLKFSRWRAGAAFWKFGHQHHGWYPVQWGYPCSSTPWVLAGKKWLHFKHRELNRWRLRWRQKLWASMFFKIL